jgi:hypothetical protein
MSSSLAVIYFISTSPVDSGDSFEYSKPLDGNETISVGNFNSAINLFYFICCVYKYMQEESVYQIGKRFLRNMKSDQKFNTQ